VNILIDIDDTVASLIPVWLNFYNKDNDDNLTEDKILNWDIGSFSKIGNRFYDYIKDPNLNLYDYIKPIYGALKGVGLMRSLGHCITFVTAYDYYNRKYYWLEKHRFLSNVDEYICTHAKYKIKGDLMIDDNFDNVSMFDGKAWLINRPWNKNFEFENRVENWKDIIKRIKEL
jgi:5'(3')-deoxyribonucleotidase